MIGSGPGRLQATAFRYGQIALARNRRQGRMSMIPVQAGVAGMFTRWVTVSS